MVMVMVMVRKVDSQLYRNDHNEIADDLTHARWQHQASGDRRRDDEFNTFEVKDRIPFYTAMLGNARQSCSQTMQGLMFTKPRAMLGMLSSIHITVLLFPSLVSASEVPEQFGATMR